MLKVLIVLPVTFSWGVDTVQYMYAFNKINICLHTPVLTDNTSVVITTSNATCKISLKEVDGWTDRQNAVYIIIIINLQ